MQPYFDFDYQALLHARYKWSDAQNVASRLADGEIDVLRSCCHALGWSSILTLAYKYYQHLPFRKAWQEALRITTFKARRVNIVYLLKTLLSVLHDRALRIRNFTRLTHSVNKVNNDSGNSINTRNAPAGLYVPQGAPLKFLVDRLNRAGVDASSLLPSTALQGATA